VDEATTVAADPADALALAVPPLPPPLKPMPAQAAPEAGDGAPSAAASGDRPPLADPAAQGDEVRTIALRFGPAPHEG
jgi:hypothetical protein